MVIPHSAVARRVGIARFSSIIRPHRAGAMPTRAVSGQNRRPYLCESSALAKRFCPPYGFGEITGSSKYDSFSPPA